MGAIHRGVEAGIDAAVQVEIVVVSCDNPIRRPWYVVTRCNSDRTRCRSE